MNEDKQIIVSAEELSLVPKAALNPAQLQLLLKHTPKKYVKKRPAKGGGTWDYVTGGYVKKCLNVMFGFNWSFNILEQSVMHGEVVVKGRLTVVTEQGQIIKEQFGNKEVVFKKGTETPLSIGNDMKAAATDALKKCAAEIGIAADIYNKEEFREITVVDNSSEAMRQRIMDEYFNGEFEGLTIENRSYIERIIEKSEEANYQKVLDLLAQKKVTRTEE